MFHMSHPMNASSGTPLPVTWYDKKLNGKLMRRVCIHLFLQGSKLFRKIVFNFKCISNFSDIVCLAPKHFFYVIYVEWRLLGNGYCKEASQWLHNAKALNECKNKCQDDCKYITFDPRDSSCFGYDSSTCNVLPVEKQETWAKGMYLFVWFQMCNVLVMVSKSCLWFKVKILY